MLNLFGEAIGRLFTFLQLKLPYADLNALNAVVTVVEAIPFGRIRLGTPRLICRASLHAENTN